MPALPENNLFPWERSFALSMAALRQALGYSQNELARRLRDRGLQFHQVTVQRVESMDRSIRLDEAFVIADELGVTLEVMVRDEASAPAQAFSHLADSRMRIKDFAEATDEISEFIVNKVEVVRELFSDPNAARQWDEVELKWVKDRLLLLQKIEKQLRTVTNSMTQFIQRNVSVPKSAPEDGRKFGEGLGALIADDSRNVEGDG